MPLGLQASVSRHPREIQTRRGVLSPRTRGPFVVLLLRIDDSGAGGVHGIGDRGQGSVDLADFWRKAWVRR